MTKSADSAADPFRQDGGELNVTVSNFTIYMICLSPHAGYNNKKRWVKNGDWCIDNLSSCSCYDVLYTAAMLSLQNYNFKQHEKWFLVRV